MESTNMAIIIVEIIFFVLLLLKFIFFTSFYILEKNLYLYANLFHLLFIVLDAWNQI